MNCYGVILAGGGGTRFWPLSRKNKPKQFLNLSGNDILVNETIDRVAEFVPGDNIFIVTSEEQKELMVSLTGGRIEENHIIAEPAARNTSACIGYAAMELVRKYGDGIMCILPSDHFIKDLPAYKKTMEEAIAIADDKDCLVTIGINPSFPATGYGYIKCGEPQKENCCRVTEFVEKPDVDTAQMYLEQGEYLWNSGMFVWKASTILEYFRKLLPDIYGCLDEIGNYMGTEEEYEAVQRIYPKIPKISIDYGIMERADHVMVVKADFGWNDVGSWDSLESIARIDENGNQNLGTSEKMLLDTNNCIMYSDHKMIAALGIDNIILVETNDVILVCNKERAQEVKRIVEELEARGNDVYL